MMYYNSGLPYSEELFHHGVKDQRWGFRRYQNEDGSLTPLGRIHYGVGKMKESAGNTAKKIGSSISTSYKRRHPGSMSTSELNAEIERQRKLNELKKVRDEYKKDGFGKKMSDLVWQSAGQGAGQLAKAAGLKLGQGIADRILENSNNKTLRELKESKDIADAAKALLESKDQYKVEKKKMEDKEKAEQEAANAEKEAAAEKDKQDKEAAAQQKKQEKLEKKAKNREERWLKEQKERAREQAKIDARSIVEKAKRDREKRADELAAKRRSIEEKTRAHGTLSASRRQEIKRLVDNVFLSSEKSGSGKSVNMSDIRNTPEYNAAVAKANELAKKGSLITVASLFS